MNKTLLIGIWASFVTLGATYAGAYWRMHGSVAPPAAEKTALHKVKPITVPIIQGGALKGYVSAEFNFLSVEEGGHGSGSPESESFFMDEAFRLIYSDSEIDFGNLQKKDLSNLSAQITANVNQRLGKQLIKETLLHNFTFVARDDMPK